MPALSLCGRSFLLAPDDFWMFMWMFVPLHLLWALGDLAKIMRESLRVLETPWEYIMVDAGICLACVPLDLLICLCSATGAIMRRRTCESFMKCLLVLRGTLAMLHFILAGVIIAPGLVTLTQHLSSNDPLLDKVPKGDIKGLGPVLQERWAILIMVISFILRILVYIGVICIECVLMLPKSMQGHVVGVGASWALRMIGAKDDVFYAIMSLIMQDVFGHWSLEEVAPTDLFFGLMLVSTKQKQGFLGFDLDEEEVLLQEESKRLISEDPSAKRQLAKLPPSVLRASELTGVHRPVTPFDVENALDQTALSEIIHIMPYASGVYGPMLFGLPVKGFQPGTMIPDRLCSAFCCMMPWCQRLPSPGRCKEWLRRRCCCLALCCSCCCSSGKTEGDWVCGMNEDFLHSEVVQGARSRGAREPELLWATWANNGPGKALPMAVLVDHEYKQLVITVRGTADMKDIVNDVCVTPKHFDPLGLGGSATKWPFDEEKDLFVPGGWLDIAEDAKRLLDYKRVLEEALAPGGQAEGYRVLVTGHSLGAAIACLLALQLRGSLPKECHVRFIGFEPAGCALSKRLFKETQRMGWLSVVCAHDWVPRLSIKNAQKMLDHALEELEACDRSKLQLTWLFIGGAIRQQQWLCGCLRRLLSTPFEWLGGGPLRAERNARRCSCCCGPYRNLPPLDIKRSGATWPEMGPPGDLVYLRPLSTEIRCCCCQKDTEWAAEWADPEDVQQEFVLSSRVMELHAPWVYEHAVERVAGRFSQSPNAPHVKAFAATPTEGGRRPR